MDYFAWGMRELVEELERRDAEIGACNHCGEPLHGLIRVHHHTENGVDVTGH